MPYPLNRLTIIIRGAGEMASGTAHRLHRAGFHRILMTEIGAPLAVRRLVSFSEAVYDGSSVVEGIEARRVGTIDAADRLWHHRIIPVLVDPDNQSKVTLKPDIIIDATLAKKNLGTTIDAASLVLGLGPGFDAGRDVHSVIETNRGHNLGRLIFDGPASPNTGTPGEISGESSRRVLRALEDGWLSARASIGDRVTRGDVICTIGDTQIEAGLAGVLRGLIRPGSRVSAGLKIGDIDPRGETSYCRTISEKARAIGGSVLEAILMRFNTGSDKAETF